MISIAIFASGSGTNAENLVRYFQQSSVARVTLIVCNNPDAYVLQRASNLGIDTLLVNREDWKQPQNLAQQLEDKNIGFIVLAGFLWLIPADLVAAYPHKIINIHPALLPKYGGKGMYGSKVHESVYQNGEHETGITIHFVNNKYDDGAIIFQKTVDIDPGSESPEDIAEKVHTLEYEWYPKVVESVILGNPSQF